MPPKMNVSIQNLIDNLSALREFSQCLDREFRCIQYWSHLAYVLKVDSQVIRQCELYSEESPTIKLFRFLKATRPRLSVKELKCALLAIERVDIYGMVNKNFKDDDEVSQVITESSLDAMDIIALELDSAKKPVANYEKLAQKLKVPHEIYRKFKMYSDYNPTYSLLRYLYITQKPIPLEQFMGYLRDMKREDVIKEIKKVIDSEWKSTDINQLNARDVLKLDSDLIKKTADLLNKDVHGVEGWRGLGRRLNVVVPSILDNLEPPCAKEVHSPTTRVIEWLAAAKPSTTINDIVQALEKINRNDAIKILRIYFNVDLSYDISDVGVLAIFSDLGDVTDTADNDPNLCQVNWECLTPTLSKPPFGIQATVQITSRIFQEEVHHFGVPSKAVKCIGRDGEKTDLITDLTSAEYQMIVLHAVAGSGKTTLVSNVAHDIIKDPYHYTVVYVDSKEIFSLNDLACKILTICGINSSQKCPLSQVIELFAHSNTNCLLILENLDQMYHSIDTMDTKSTSRTGANESPWQKSMTSKKGEFQGFLKDITTSAPKLKVLVTTWESVAFTRIKVKQMTLHPLDEEKSLELLRSQSKLQLIDKEALESIFKCCGGIPLLLCAAVVFLSNMGSVKDACEWFASSSPEEKLETLCPDSLPEEERFNYCLEKCFERINVCSKQVLVIVSVFPNAFTLKEAEHISKGIIEFKELKKGFESLQQFSFLNPYDSATKSYTLHPAIRSFGLSKAKEGELKPVFETARQIFIYYTFGKLSQVEEEFFSTQGRSAIQKYRLQDESIREIARWCISDDCMDVKVKEFCIDSFIGSQYILLKLMRSHPLKLILCKFAQLCQTNDNTKLYCECLILGGAKIVFGCVCPPYVCQTALNRAFWCFCKVIEALEADQIKTTEKSVKELASYEVLSTIYNCKFISNQSKAQFLIKCGKCLVRHGYKELGFYYIQIGLKIRSQCYKDSPTKKTHVMLAVGCNDFAGDRCR